MPARTLSGGAGGVRAGIAEMLERAAMRASGRLPAGPREPSLRLRRDLLHSTSETQWQQCFPGKRRFVYFGGFQAECERTRVGRHDDAHPDTDTEAIPTRRRAMLRLRRDVLNGLSESQ
jgi:hypothetical protein